MVLGKGCIGVQISKQVGVKPLRQLLDSNKFVWAVVELVPNAVKIPRLLCRDAGIGVAGSEPFELLARQARIRPWSERNPVAAGHIGLPVGAGNHHVEGVGDDDLFGADLPEG